MPAPVPPSFPALYLYPLNDPLSPKHISLLHGQHVKIGRQTNAKTAPGERNGYFDSKVLSRQHAEVWEESSKIFIRDTKSSNGTFINGERLSLEGLDSDPFELKSDDIVEFGIDIVGEDNKTIIHHKVAARVVCVLNEQDAQMAARTEQLQQQHSQQYSGSNAQGSSILSQPGPSNINANGVGTFNFAPGQPRRPQQLAQHGLTGMGGMGGSMRPPGKSGLTFDHILSRLQGELQKSRETGAELHSLTGAMNEIHDTLSGNLPNNLPSYPPALPPVRPQSQLPTQPPSQERSAPVSGSGSPEQGSVVPSTTLATSTLVDLQAKLQETQSSLTSHVDKIRVLEGALAEQESIKREVRALREMMEAKRQEMAVEEERPREPERQLEPQGGFDEEEEEAVDDDSDANSIATIVPHELERVEEEDEEQLAAEARAQEMYQSDAREQEREREQQDQPDDEIEDDEEGRRRRNDELGRPRTPEPTNLGMRNGEPFGVHHTSKLLSAPRRTSPSSPLSKVAASATSQNPNEEMFGQILKQVESLMALTSSLEAQHTAAQSTISALESKVQTLEATVKATQDAAATSHVQSQVQTSPPASPTKAQLPPLTAQTVPTSVEERESLSAMVLEWKKSMEGQWSSVREDWDKERERLNQAREQWEGQIRNVNSGLEKLGATTAALKVQQDQIQQQQQHFQRSSFPNGDALKHIGLVTPPSPRSLSSDSNRPRRRKSSSGSKRGRSRQRSRSHSLGSRDGDTDTDATLANDDSPPTKSGVVLSTLGKFKSAIEEDEEEDGEDGEDTVLGVRSKSTGESGAEMLATPESSVYKLPTRTAFVEQHPETKLGGRRDRDLIQFQTAVGVLILGVAAAAVIWRVKPET